MANFSYKYEEVMDLNWFTFNDLLEGLRGVRIEKENQELSYNFDNYVVANSKDSVDVLKKLKDSKKDLFSPYTKYDTSERDIKELRELMKGKGGKL